MIRYVALLRGINVGGRNLIKMQDLARVFTQMGFKNVRTHIQSGNVIFDGVKSEPNALRRKIERELLKSLGHEGSVMLRTLEDLEGIVKRNPFKTSKPGDDVVMFVTFLSAEPEHKPSLPLQSSRENLEVLAIKDRAAFTLVRRKRTGRFGYPNNFIEKELVVSATTRNWTTIEKIVALAKS